MNFFASQEKARKSTGRLIGLFALAVILIIIGVYFVLELALLFSGVTGSTGEYVRGETSLDHWSIWNPAHFLVITVGVALFIGGASLFQINKLRKGGVVVATTLGGIPISPNTKDAAERRLLNVVEEMAIASGTPVPQVYVLPDEEGINAFAAGYSPANAVVAVTRGTLQELSREQLQGVVAHEFSHILNGDMRMNIKLMGILFGILALGLIGRIIIRATPRTRRSRSHKGGLAVPLVGLALIIVGYIGSLLGRMIQAAVSRQREFLADASAVQFTRNPDGIGGALKKIGGYGPGSRIASPQADQASHFFFGEGRPARFFQKAMATHPPLVERITRIDQHFDGNFETVSPAGRPQAEGRSTATEIPMTAAFAPQADAAGAASTRTLHLRPETMTKTVGSLSGKRTALGAALLAGIPEALREAIRTPTGALAAVYALLLDPDPEQRAGQLELLQDKDPKIVDEVRTRLTETDSLDQRLRLPLVELALPALKQIEPEALMATSQTLEALIMADGKIELLEFAVHWLLQHRLIAARNRPVAVRYKKLKELSSEVSVILSAVADFGNQDDPIAAREAYRQGADRAAGFSGKELVLEFQEDIAWDRVGRALSALAASTYPIREKVIDACAHSALADKAVTVREAELLRLISISLDCPLPPIFPEGAV